MGRLTKRIADEATLNGTGDVPCKTICDRMYEYDHPCDMCPINEAIKKLAHYEDMEEAGRLIEQKHGHWKEIGDYDGESHWQCSACEVEWWYEAGTPLENQTYYCPKCGVKMDFEIELKEDE